MRRLVLALLAAALLAPASALAQSEPLTFRGVTGQGHDVLFLHGTESVQRVDVIGRPRCRDGTRIRLKTTSFGPVGDRRIGRVLNAVGRYRWPEHGGRIALIRIRMRGRLRGPAADVGRQVWQGTLRARVDVHRHGVPSDRCSLSTRWRAKPEGIGTGRWTMSEAGLYERARTFDSSTVAISAKANGTRRMFSIEAEPEEYETLDATFTAPLLNTFAPGRRFVTQEGVYGAAQFDMFGNESGCRGGWIETQAIEFDELRRLVHVRVAWEQPCPDGRPPWTGLIEWRAVA